MMNIIYREPLALWKAWRDAKKILGENKITPTQMPFCKCECPSLYWNESPSDPDIETEHCFICGHYTNWNRTKDNKDSHGWHQEINDQTGEIRFRNEKEGLLLTASEYKSRNRYLRGTVPNEEIGRHCRKIANDFGVPMAKEQIYRRFGRTATISRGRGTFTGVIHATDRKKTIPF